MAKSKADIVRVRKLQFNAGQAKPGPALAGVGINMPEFTRAFNDATRDRAVMNLFLFKLLFTMTNRLNSNFSLRQQVTN